MMSCGSKKNACTRGLDPHKPSDMHSQLRPLQTITNGVHLKYICALVAKTLKPSQMICHVHIKNTWLCMCIMHSRLRPSQMMSFASKKIPPLLIKTLTNHHKIDYMSKKYMHSHRHKWCTPTKVCTLAGVHVLLYLFLYFSRCTSLVMVCWRLVKS